MASIRQPSFAAGELAPMLHGRTDLPRFEKGLRRLFNMFVARQGPTLSRAGTQFLGTASSAQVDVGPISGPPDFVTAGGVVRLFTFKWSDTDTAQNYLLVWGAKTLQIWKNGALLIDVNGLSGGVGVPYLRDDLPKMSFAQSGDQVFIACPGYAPALLSRADEATWTYSLMDFSRPAPTDPSNNALDPRLDGTTLGTSDQSHPPKPWSWLVTTLTKDTRGLVTESTGARVVTKNNVSDWSATVPYILGTLVKDGASYFTSTQWFNLNHATTDTGFWAPATAPASATTTLSGDTNVALYPDRQVTLQLYEGAFHPLEDPNFVSYRIYRGRAGVYGWVGDSRGPNFVDDGSDPDFNTAPPQGLNPFVVLNDDGTVLRTEHPISVCFYEDRLTFFGTSERPTFLFQSAVGDYFNFDQRLIPVDDEALIFALEAREREVARFVVGKDKLFAGTDGAVWAVSGAGGDAIKPDSIDAHVQADVGADWPRPLIDGPSILWVRDKGTGVRAIAYDFLRGDYSSADLSLPAEHLFLSHRVVDWAFQKDPWGVVWAVREDGVLLSLTYSPDDQLWGWAQHALCVDADENPGAAMSVAVVTEGDEDAVYVAMTGNDGTGDPPAWILRMTTRQETATKTPVTLDAFLEFDGPAVTVVGGNNVIALTGLAHLKSRPVWAVVDGSPLGPFTVDGSGHVTIVLGPHQVGHSVVVGIAYVGLPYDMELESLELPQDRTKPKVVNEVGLELQGTGLVEVGPTLDDGDLKPKTVKSNEPLVCKFSCKGTWNTGGRIAVRRSVPLPLRVLGITREVATGEG